MHHINNKKQLQQKKPAALALNKYFMFQIGRGTFGGRFGYTKISLCWCVSIDLFFIVISPVVVRCIYVHSTLRSAYFSFEH